MTHFAGFSKFRTTTAEEGERERERQRGNDGCKEVELA